jgi:O-antigen/teichoic acid export membrane protein
METRSVVLGRVFLASYMKVVSGSLGRGAINVVFFLLLANTLSLGDFGVFATASAVGLILATASGFGFAPILFRGATMRPALVPWYLGATYFWFALSLLPCLLVAAALHPLIFSAHIELTPLLLIVGTELALWRLIDIVGHLNNGMSRYMRGALGPIITAAMRLVAAALFWWSGSHDIETWAVFYLVATLFAAVLYIALFHPRLRPRWSGAVVFGHLPGAAKAAVAEFVSQAQADIDKLVIMLIAGDHAAGLYAIAMRLLDLTALPIRSFYILMIQRLLRMPLATWNLMRSVHVEIGIAVVSLAGFTALVVATWLVPSLLGRNVMEAAPLFTALLAAPVFRNLLECHSEVLFAARSYGARVVLALFTLVVKLALVAALAMLITDPFAWGFWLNAIFLVTYAFSAGFTYATLNDVRAARRGVERVSLATAGAAT